MNYDGIRKSKIYESLRNLGFRISYEGVKPRLIIEARPERGDCFVEFNAGRDHVFLLLPENDTPLKPRHGIVNLSRRYQTDTVTMETALTDFLHLFSTLLDAGIPFKEAYLQKNMELMQKALNSAREKDTLKENDEFEVEK